MSATFDDTSIMPNAAAIATAQTAITLYNDEMPAARRAVYVNYATKLLPFSLAVIFLVWLFIFGMDGASPNFRSILLTVTGIGSYYFGSMLWTHVHAPVTGLRQHTRDKLIPHLFGFVENVSYSNGREPRFMARLPAKTVVQYTRIVYDDAVRGRYAGTEFELCEMHFFNKAGKSETETFRGVVFQFPLATVFPGEMVITRRRTSWDKFWWGSPQDRHLVEIVTGDTWTDGSYEVKTDNRSAGMPLARANLPKLLRWLETTWDSGAPKIVLKAQDGYLLLPSRKNFFELPPNGVVLDYRSHAEPMVRELVALVATANLVRLAFEPAPPVRKPETEA